MAIHGVKLTKGENTVNKMKFDKCVLLACPKCASTNIKADLKRIERTGEDWFVCTTCGEKFQLKNAGYEQ